MLMWMMSIAIGFQQLSDATAWNDKEIEIRGFIYQVDQQYYLASEPNIKTCCMGKKTKILLSEKFPEVGPGQVVSLQGTFFVDDDGAYHLKVKRE